MSNITVYPYGTGGTLPSSIGIVNDLTTGGSDKALAAQQGKVIGTYLFEHDVPVDLSGITVSSYSLGTDSKWNVSGLHSVIPVTPGDVLKVDVLTSEADGAWYGFLTSSYVVPTSASTVPYVSGTNRVWLYTGEQEMTVPETAAYLCICPRDGSGKNSTWSVSKCYDGEINDDFVATDSDMLNVEVAEEVDIQSITVSNCSLGGSNTWIPGGGDVARHIVVPVSSGQRVKVLAADSTSTGNFRAFLTSSYVVPTSGSIIPYVTGTTREWQFDSSGWVELTCPNDTAYLCLVTSNGDGDTTSWRVIKYSKVPINEAALTKGDVVDNLTDGGADVPLSAKQGKKLGMMVTGGKPIPSVLTKYEYSGGYIGFSPVQHYVAKDIVSTVGSKQFQGGACYGNYLFMFTEYNTKCWIYDLSTGSLVQEISTIERGFVSDCHCNTVNFGTEKYDADDPFPLIYVSTGYNSGGYSGALAYRIGVTEGTYSLTLVQTIKIPGTTLDDWSEFIVGDDGDCYIRFTNVDTVYRMVMPKVSEGDVILDPSDALEVYRFTAQPFSSSNQNHFYYKGKIYMVSGATSNSGLLIVLDLATRTRETVIDLNAIGITNEPESCFIWDGLLCIVCRNHTNVYALYFE